MFKRFVSWFKEFFGFAEQVVEPLPDDAWQRMFALAEKAKLLKLPDINISHFDVNLAVFSKNVDELFMRFEMMISCIEKEEDTPHWWDERGRTRYLDPLPDFYYEIKPGYRHPQKVLEMLLEKVEVIHNLLEVKKIDVNHQYYHYMRKEFYSIVSDTLEVLNVSFALGNQK
jgi:hypothetical protein